MTEEWIRDTLPGDDLPVTEIERIIPRKKDDVYTFAVTLSASDVYESRELIASARTLLDYGRFCRSVLRNTGQWFSCDSAERATSEIEQRQAWRAYLKSGLARGRAWQRDQGQ